jgi:hypothetical protein
MKLQTVLSAVAALAGATTVLAPASPAAAITGTKTIKGASLCFDLPSSQTASGTRVQLWTCNGTDAQKWVFHSDGTIRPQLNDGRCLDVGNWWDSANWLQIFDCNWTNAQLWDTPTYRVWTETPLQQFLVNRAQGWFVDVSPRTRGTVPFTRYWNPWAGGDPVPNAPLIVGIA